VCCDYAGYQVWTSFFRYRAYGVVTGRVVAVAPPWDGVVHYAVIREGDPVRQGQLLVVVDNLDLRPKAAQLGDEIRIAQATREADRAKLKWQLASTPDRPRGPQVMYYEAGAQLLSARPRLAALRCNLQRARTLDRTQAIAREEVDALTFTAEGLEQKIAKA